MLIDTNIKIILNCRAYIQWLNTMEQLVPWVDVLFMSGILDVQKFVLGLLGHQILF